VWVVDASVWSIMVNKDSVARVAYNQPRRTIFS
jgi:hypothetical protein